MSSEPIILFDIPDKDGSNWSFNPWKTRFLLNYKGVDHKTEWVEYPDIKPRLQGHIASHNSDSTKTYTVPTIKLPSGEYIMDSKAIAAYITSTYPSPPLQTFDAPMYPRVLSQMQAIVNEAFFGIFIPLVPEVVLSPGSAEYFQRTRSEEYGPLDELARTKGGKVGWDRTEKGLRAVTALLKENTDGPFFEGSQVSYADFCWAGILLFTQKLGDDVFAQVLRRSGDGRVHEGLLEAVKPWGKIK